MLEQIVNGFSMGIGLGAAVVLTAFIVAMMDR